MKRLLNSIDKFGFFKRMKTIPGEAQQILPSKIVYSRKDIEEFKQENPGKTFEIGGIPLGVNSLSYIRVLPSPDENSSKIMEKPSTQFK